MTNKTQVLASVRSIEEAQLVLAHGGIGVLDIKDPDNGALGALSTEAITAIVKQVNGQCLTSATVGDLPPDPQQLIDAIERTRACGVDYIKLGFFSSEYLDCCLAAIAALSQTTALVGVLFADRFAHLDGPTKLLKAAGFRGVMVDTADKTTGSLFNSASQDSLHQFVQTAHAQHLFCGIAGSLGIEDIDRVLQIAPDYIGFRGALCEASQRKASINVAALERVLGQVNARIPEAAVAAR